MTEGGTGATGHSWLLSKKAFSVEEYILCRWLGVQLQ